MSIQALFSATMNSWILPVALTIITWAVISATLSRFYNVPQLMVKLSQTLLIAALATLALAAWLAWASLN